MSDDVLSVVSLIERSCRVQCMTARMPKATLTQAHSQRHTDSTYRSGHRNVEPRKHNQTNMAIVTGLG